MTITRGVQRIVDLVDAVRSLEVDLVGPMSAEACRIVADPMAPIASGSMGAGPTWRAGRLPARRCLVSACSKTPVPIGVPFRPKVLGYMTSGLAVLASDLPAQAAVVQEAAWCSGRLDEASAVVAGWVDAPSRRLRPRRNRPQVDRIPAPSHQPLCDAVLPPSTL